MATLNGCFSDASSKPRTNEAVEAVIQKAQGVRLKRFEAVVARLLPVVVPNYVQLPPLPLESNGRSEWPFHRLTPSAGVFGSLPGQIAQPERSRRKEEQVTSMLRCILPLIPAASKTVVVDFGGGSGHLSIPLALLRPECTVICLDLSKQSLDLLHQKASRCVTANEITDMDEKTCTSTSSKKSETAIRNLFSYHGAADTFPEQFNIAVALHLCGEATDVVLQLAGSLGASSIVAAPCCVGKLSADKRNPYVFQATGQNHPTVQYPRSSVFCQVITEQKDWNALAKAADYSDAGECRTSRNAVRRTAKALLETDRQCFLEEAFGYETALMRMDPWEATPKNDIIVAWARQGRNSIATRIDNKCQADIQLTIDYLLPSKNPGNRQLTVSPATASDNVDWTHDEEYSIRNKLQEFIGSGQEVLVFPVRMGGRKRKLVHFLAEQVRGMA
jgi:Methyltransferase domain